jgi:hypothetical protein
MLIILFENSIDAFFFDAFFTAAGAIFPEFNRGVFADGMKPRRRCLNWNMILLGHKLLRYLLLVLGESFQSSIINHSGLGIRPADSTIWQTISSHSMAMI